jgi:MoaA/NifB/PqqE/SkfB family radical SAM enzyme/ubiquinone/menaquinone biosynthesis C-methylase UbiE
MNPQVAAFFKDYLAQEKVVRFGEQYVLNTHFPPFPSTAFDNMAGHFDAIGGAEGRRLFSVTLAVTNRCTYRCWHCYNAGRSQEDLPLAELRKVVSAIQGLGAVHVTLTGGEPLIRRDLEEIASAFDKRTYLSLNTTGAGLNLDRAISLRKAGIFALGVSLDSLSMEEHDRMRGKKGAFETARAALSLAVDAGLYPYVISVATRSLLEESHFMSFLRFALDAGAREVHLLEPCATGNLSGKAEVVLTSDEKKLILGYQKEVARDESLPILSSFLYLESAEAFGCGAGLTHLYIDGSGEVCPCNLVPLSFGNITHESLEAILERMGKHFFQPRCNCVGQDLAPNIRVDHLPLALEQSEALCEKLLPKSHPVPRFFEVRARTKDPVGQNELKQAYDEIHTYYDDYWLTQAAGPVDNLLRELPIEDAKTIIECGCGTGYATSRIAKRLLPDANFTAVDLSKGMLDLARKRLSAQGDSQVRYVHGDALSFLELSGAVDLIISTWVLGYIPLAPFFTAVSRALKDRGVLAFVAHKDNSPREPFEIFQRIVAQDPSALLQSVSFDFPRNREHLEELFRQSGLEIHDSTECPGSSPKVRRRDCLFQCH